MENNRYNQFINLNRQLLDCYAQVHPKNYILMDEATQKDVCFSERLRLEEMLIKGRVQPADFFAANQ